MSLKCFFFVQQMYIPVECSVPTNTKPTKKSGTPSKQSTSIMKWSWFSFLSFEKSARICFFFFPQISYHWLNMEAHCTHTWTLFQRSGSHFFNLMSQFPENTQLCVTETLTCVKCNKIGLRDGRKDTNVYITITTWWQRT